jgi:tousled-like kinase
VRISNKVDVWSLGVIYFQMLFGIKPFGDGQSQERVLSNALYSNQVKFPAKPAVSAAAKEFIELCLTHDQALRPDMIQLCSNEYLRLKKI